MRKSKLAEYIDYLCQSQWGIIILSLVFAVVVVLAMSLLFGVYPREIMLALFEGAFKGNSLESTIEQIAPFTLAGLAVFFPFIVGFFNIGGEGQLWVGALAAVFVTLNYQGPPVLVIPLALLVATLAGVVAVIIPLILKLKLGATTEVTTTIMANFICIYFVQAMFTSVMRDPGAFYGTTYPVPQMFRLPVISLLGINFHIGVLFAIIVVIGVYLLIKHTVYGVQLRAIGFNRDFAHASGISINKVVISATFVGAAIAGFAGGVQVLGASFRVADGWSLGWGWAGIAIAFLSSGNALAIIVIAFIFAILGTGGTYMQALTGVPAALVYVLQNLPILAFLSLKAWQSLRKGS